jgi:flagellar biosynthetic protein FliO
MRKPLSVTLVGYLLCVCVCCCACAAADKANHEPTQSTAVALDRDSANRFLASLESKQEEQPREEEESLIITALSFIAKLAVVLALAYVSILGLKRFGTLRTALGGGGQRIKVIENSALGANRSLHLVEVGKRKLLLASTPTQISLVTEIKAEDLPVASPENDEAGQDQCGFKQHLDGLLKAEADVSKTSMIVAGALRGSSNYLQSKVAELSALGRRLRDAKP